MAEAGKSDGREDADVETDFGLTALDGEGILFLGRFEGDSSTLSVGRPRDFRASSAFLKRKPHKNIGRGTSPVL